MDESVLFRLMGLAKSLRESADVLLDQAGVLSLDTWTLYEVEEAFSLILQVEQHTNFHVLPTNHSHHPAIPLLQFVYDLLQRTQKICIWTKPGQALPMEQTINLRCLRNLQLLELDHVPLSQLKGLQNLRPILKSLIISGISCDLSLVLLYCGADKSSEFLWEKLTSAIFSHNTISRLDSSLRLLPAIKVLDLSYCGLRDATCLLCLPTISQLNLSFNKLSTFPSFSPNAATSLMSLSLRNNLIINMKGLEMLTNLEEFDISFNLLSIEDSLKPLSRLPHLKCLTLEGNPISYNINFRLHTVRYLNPATIFSNQFLFDGTPLNSEESKEIGLFIEKHSLNLSNVHLMDSLSTTLSNILTPSAQTEEPHSSRKSSSGFIHGEQAVQVHATEQNEKGSFNSTLPTKSHSCSKRRNKVKKPRHVSILDPNENGEYPTPGSQTSFTDYLNKHFSKNALDSKIAELSSSLLTSTSLEDKLHFATHSDKLLEEILHSANLDAITQHGDNGSQMNAAAMESSMISSTNSSFFKADEKGGDDAFSRQSSEEFTAIASENEDGESCLMSILAKINIDECPNSEGTELLIEDVILSLSSNCFKEKNAITCKTLVSWPISSIESLDIVSTEPFQARLDFDSIKKEDSTRTYFIQPDEFEELKVKLDDVRERKTMKTLLTDSPAFQCDECNKIFQDDSGVNCDYCNNCGGSLSPVKMNPQKLQSFDVFNTVSPFSRNGSGFNPTKSPSNSTTRRSETSLGQGESSESVSVCSEGSLSHKRQSSDGDGVSNPSLSSIEVLNDNSNGLASEDISSNQEKELKDLVSASFITDARTPPATHDHVNSDITPMQESSSSGSMTGSVCTALENTASNPGTPLHLQDPQAHNFDSSNIVLGETNSDNGSKSSYETAANMSAHSSLQIGTPHSYIAVQDSSQPNNTAVPCISCSSKSTETVCSGVSNGLPDGILLMSDRSSVPLLSMWDKALQFTFTGYSTFGQNPSPSEDKRNEDLPSFSYSYDDSSAIDHRLKLYFEVFLFDDSNEILLRLIKAVIMVRKAEESCSIRFNGLLVISTKNIYVIEIARDESDDPQDWLQEHFICPLEDVTCLKRMLNDQAVGLTMGEMLVLISLADSTIGQWALASLHSGLTYAQSLENESSKELDITCVVSHQEVLLDQILRSTSCYNLSTSPCTFIIVSLLEVDGKASNQYLVVTSSHLFLFEADLDWLLLSPDSESCNLSCTKSEKIMDLTSIEVYSERILSFNFTHEDVNRNDSSWLLHFGSSNSTGEVVKAVRPSWFALFQLDLDVKFFFVPSKSFLKQLESSI